MKTFAITILPRNLYSFILKYKNETKFLSRNIIIIKSPQKKLSFDLKDSQTYLFTHFSNRSMIIQQHFWVVILTILKLSVSTGIQIYTLLIHKGFLTSEHRKFLLCSKKKVKCKLLKPTSNPLNPINQSINPPIKPIQSTEDLSYIVGSRGASQLGGIF